MGPGDVEDEERDEYHEQEPEDNGYPYNEPDDYGLDHDWNWGGGD